MVAKPVRLSLLAALVVVVLSGAAHLSAQTAPSQIPVPLPPMGWSSWNTFSNTINSQIVMDQAKAMAANGMQKAGYQYINIDEGWWLGARDKDGNITVEPKAWPAIAPGEQAGDMSNIVRYVHSLGLKAGIYTDAGAYGCSTVSPDLGPSYPNTGSADHYEQDFLQFAKWGFDYVKVDWCGGERTNLDPAIQYAEIARAILRAEAITGHPLYYSICNWGRHSPWSWAPNTGGVTADIWRTGGDIVAPIVANSKNSGRKAEFKEVLREFDQAQHPQAQHTGFYNDPDMMVVGMQGLTDQESRAHMALWAISGGPLLVGADLTKISPVDIATLTNPDVIRIDQDTLGLQSVKVAEVASSPAGQGLEVWAKPLSTSGERAVILLNRSASPAPISVSWSDLGLLDDSPATVKDVWTHSDLGPFKSTYSATVPARDAVLLLIKGSEGAFTAYKPDAAKEHLASAHPSGFKNQDLRFINVVSKFPIGRIRITYANHEKAPRFAELRVNGQIATRISFPTTGAASGTISVQSPMDTKDTRNVLTFSFPSDPGPAIQSISVQ